MPANCTYLVCLTVATLVLLLFLILVVKLHAFVALLISAMAMGLASGMPPDKVLKSIQFGFGDALGFIAVVVGMGAMIGRFLEYSGGGRALADWLLEKFGNERAAWAVVDNDLLPDLLGELGAEDARNRVGRAAGCLRDDELDRLVRILRRRAGREHAREQQRDQSKEPHMTSHACHL